MKTNELREKYLAFFESKGHTRVASDVLVPTWDPSVLFTPAGMNQFKDHFLGKVKLDYTRATSCQKCMRTGDIDNVGRTPRHHTFFEMLGNFSFGDYFKRDAIHWAWEFLTDKKWLGLPEETLHVTVYKDDQEAADIWHEQIGLPTSRIKFEDEDENFWPASAPSQGPDGVCGPCSEIYYTAPGRQELEIWNLVFTQFNRVGDPPDNLRPLPSKNIDTGMGLERTAAALQDVETNFHIDILKPIVDAAAEVCSVKYSYDSDHGRRLRRITDHVRACTFSVHENVYPGNNKEKYVVKRLLRRAVLDGHQLGMREPFLCKLVPAVVEQMADTYPELNETVKRVSDVIAKEEANFFATIDGGLNRIDAVFQEMKRDNRTMVDGNAAADLYQTYGVPPELFESLAAEQKLAFDWDGYAQAMAAHGEMSGKIGADVMNAKGPIDALKTAGVATEFLGYEQDCLTDTTIKGIVIGDRRVESLAASDLSADDRVSLVLDRTPFYGESGGQVGDQGVIQSAAGNGCEFEVQDTQKDGSLFVHTGRLTSGSLAEGDTAQASVDLDRRAAIRRAHSATHLLHHALHKHLGEHAQQQGSKVDADWLRFDFTNLSPVDPDQLAAISADVRAYIAHPAEVKWETLPLADARQQGAMMLFGEKYPDPVRMVSMGPLVAENGDQSFSRELCGGTHLRGTSAVGAFEILSEEGVSAGTRRIVALTGDKARQHAAQVEAAADRVAALLKVSPGDLLNGVSALLDQQKALKKAISGGGHGELTPYQSASKSEATYEQKKAALTESARKLSASLLDTPARVEVVLAEIQSLTQQLAARDAAGPMSADLLLEQAFDIAGAKVIIAETPGATPDLMRKLIDGVRQKAQGAAVMLASAQGDDKVTLVAGITKDLQENGFSAGKWIGPVAKALGGGGGGRPDMAQAGGKQPDKLPEAFKVAKEQAQQQLA